MAHCWTEERSIKGKFCNVCRKKMHEVPGVRCEGGFIRSLYPSVIASDICYSFGYLSKIVYVPKLGDDKRSSIIPSLISSILISVCDYFIHEHCQVNWNIHGYPNSKYNSNVKTVTSFIVNLIQFKFSVITATVPI